MKIRLYLLLLCLAFAAGCGARGSAVTATARPAAASVTVPQRNPRSCGLPQVNPEKYRTRAQAESYAARALRCAVREHRSAYYPYPGDLVCLTASRMPQARSGDVGAAIQAGPVTLAHPVAPGRSEALPPVYIEDNGSGPETMTLSVQNDRPYCADVLPPAWISGTGRDIGLGAGQGDDVTGLAVHVPAGTPPGTYRSDIAVDATAGIVAGAVNFGAGAACEITVTVR